MSKLKTDEDRRLSMELGTIPERALGPEFQLNDEGQSDSSLSSLGASVSSPCSSQTSEV